MIILYAYFIPYYKNDIFFIKYCILYFTGFIFYGILLMSVMKAQNLHLHQYSVQILLFAEFAEIADFTGYSVK